MAETHTVRDHRVSMLQGRIEYVGAGLEPQVES